VGLFSNFNNNIFKIKIILMIMFLSSEWINENGSCGMKHIYHDNCGIKF
jgi:hypothetical protein